MTAWQHYRRALAAARQWRETWQRTASPRAMKTAAACVAIAHEQLLAVRRQQAASQRMRGAAAPADLP